MPIIIDSFNVHPPIPVTYRYNADGYLIGGTFIGVDEIASGTGN